MTVCPMCLGLLDSNHEHIDRYSQFSVCTGHHSVHPMLLPQFEFEPVPVLNPFPQLIVDNDNWPRMRTIGKNVWNKVSEKVQDLVAPPLPEPTW